DATKDRATSVGVRIVGVWVVGVWVIGRLLVFAAGCGRSGFSVAGPAVPGSGGTTQFTTHSRPMPTVPLSSVHAHVRRFVGWAVRISTVPAYLGGPSWPEMDAALAAGDLPGAVRLAQDDARVDPAERQLVIGVCCSMTGRGEQA